MDSSKRKVNGASVGADNLDDRASKRRKASDHTEPSKGETPETTKENGLKFLDVIKKTEDKSGRLIAADFLTLPNKRQLPDYYKVIKMPLALDTIETKLIRHEVPNLSTLESLFKRLIANAREYNERGTRIYDDAERLRKALSNFMTKNNPAYKTQPGYTAIPTPIPGEEDEEDEDAEGEEESEPEIETETPPKRRGRPPKNAPYQGSRKSATPALLQAPKYVGVSFSGLNFQQAQEKVVEDLMEYKEDPRDDFAGFEPFIELPDRSLKDYYIIIPNPVSLVDLQKRVKGIRGRSATGVSEFKNWAAFEEETSFIWRNAYHYNEDGSDIFVLAKELENFFKKKIQEAKKAVPEPAGPKIKLKMPDAPKITLKLGPKGSPTGSPAPQMNGSNGNGIPINGASRRNPFGGSHSSATPIPSLDQLEKARSMSGSVASPTPSNAAPVKNEDAARNSPALAAGQVLRAGSQALSTPGLNGSGMPPPSTPGLQHNLSQSGFAQSFNHQSQYPTPNPAYESKWRLPGKNASDAMMSNLSLATHPGLNLSKHFRMDLPPSPTMAQQSITINLPSSHYYLQIKPTIAPSLLERQYKLFVTSGTQRLHAMPTIPGQSLDNRHPLFEARLLPGVNRIEIELIAALPKGAPKPTNGQDVEMEKITVFANLMR